MISQSMAPLLLDAAADGRLDPPALSAASAALFEAVASAVDGRITGCRGAMAAALVAGDGGLERGLGMLVSKCIRLQYGSVVRVDEAMVQVPMHPVCSIDNIPLLPLSEIAVHMTRGGPPPTLALPYPGPLP